MRVLVPTLLAALLIAPTVAALKPDVIRSSGAVPAHVAGRFRDPAGFQQSASGQYFVFDRRAHTVYGLDPQQSSVWEIAQIGAEQGRIIDPTAFAVAPNGTFVVADAPNNRERIQIFTPAGFRIGGFLLPGRLKTRVMIDSAVLNGIGSLQYGGFFFVFQTGEPVLQKYDGAGQLLFERHVEGREIDRLVASLPTQWPTRQTSEGELPLVTPTIRTAAVDRAGQLWIAFVVPYTYVYDRDGDKVRTVQFRAAGVITPNSLFFGRSGRVLVTPGLYEFE